MRSEDEIRKMLDSLQLARQYESMAAGTNEFAYGFWLGRVHALAWALNDDRVQGEAFGVFESRSGSIQIAPTHERRADGQHPPSRPACADENRVAKPE